MKSRSKAQHDFPGSPKLLRLRNLWYSDRGQSLIELALLTPVLLILVIGIAGDGLVHSTSRSRSVTQPVPGPSMVRRI